MPKCSKIHANTMQNDRFYYSSKLLQIQGKWYQERKPKQKSKTWAKKNWKLFWTHFEWYSPLLLMSTGNGSKCFKQESAHWLIIYCCTIVDVWSLYGSSTMRFLRHPGRSTAPHWGPFLESCPRNCLPTCLPGLRCGLRWVFLRVHGGENPLPSSDQTWQFFKSTIYKLCFDGKITHIHINIIIYMYDMYEWFSICHVWLPEGKPIDWHHKWWGTLKCR